MSEQWSSVVHSSLLSLTFMVMGAVAHYIYFLIKERLKKDGVGLTKHDVECIISSQADKCVGIFATPEDLERTHRLILDEMHRKFVTKDEAGKLSENIRQLHDDFKEDFRDLKEQLSLINKVLLEGRG